MFQKVAKVKWVLILLFLVEVAKISNTTGSSLSLPLETSLFFRDQYGIQELNLETGIVTSLITYAPPDGYHLRDFEVHKDIEILYVIEGEGNNYDANIPTSQLTAINISTGQRSIILTNNYLLEFELSPNRLQALVIKSIPYVLGNSIRYSQQICVLNLQTNICNSANVTPDSKIYWIDDQTLLFDDRVGGRVEFALLNTANLTISKVSFPHDFDISVFVPMPQGRNVFIIGYLSDSTAPLGYVDKLAILDINTGILTYLPYTGAYPDRFVAEISISPDETALLYRFQDHYGVIDISDNILNFDITFSTMLMPHWSIDSQYLYAISQSNGIGSVFKINRTTGQAELLTQPIATPTFIPTPSPTDLTALVMQCVTDRGIRNSLTVKINNTQWGAFISEVEAQRGKKITVACVDQLIEMATYLRDNP